ncbi:histone H4 transcription factor isoform X1 [Syngnathoides biaculeatus]|uniref:histone H4 transcription factor isoform X1 n=1 Tax=Syngnathoides biaculeatus TaxID=300417 RepID=UPI002ADDFAE6|nr:histone H4 transcription factor isoform X1 [Syngnathoides biaculeatus]
MMSSKRLDRFEVACEWASCNYRGRGMEELSDHMSEHLRDYLGDKDALEDLDEYACLWKGCEFISMGSSVELEAHAYFHNYHGKLKFVGSQLLQSHPDLPACNQAAHNNNLLPEGSDRHQCQWESCDSTFTNPEWFYRHVDNHVESAEQQQLSCQQQALHCRWSSCDAFFKIRYRLREHMRSHTQERLVACPTCGSMFSSNTKLFDHLHRQARPVDSLVCEHCGKAFSSERLLRDHVRQHGEGGVHRANLKTDVQTAANKYLNTFLSARILTLKSESLNQVKCPFCDMTCTTLAALKIHIRFRHCDERPFPCDFCEKSFKNQRDLQKHTDVHNEGSVFHCSVEGCEYSCQTFQTMNHHFKRVHEVGGMSKYKCHLCDKVFSWCYTLTLHLRKKHELKWPSGHSRFRYRKDVDGFLKLNMVRVETEEVTKEIMKNMNKKPVSLRKSQRSRSERAAVTPDSGRPSAEDAPARPGPRGGCGDSPVYCVMSAIPHIEDDLGGSGQEECDPAGTSGAVRALTAVARGLGMDVV